MTGTDRSRQSAGGRPAHVRLPAAPAHSVGAASPAVALLNGLLNPVMVVVTLLVCTWAYGYSFTGHDLVLAVVVFFISAQVLDDVDLFTPWRPFQMTRVARNILAGWAIVVSVIVFLGYASRLSDEFAQEVVLTWFAVTPFVLFASIKIARVAVRRAVAMTDALRSTVVIGANDLGRRLARRVGGDPYLAMDLRGFFDDRSPERLGAMPEGPLLGRIAEVPDYVRRNGIHLVYISLPMAAQPRIMRLVEELRDTTASVYFVPDIFVFDLIQARFDEVAGIPVVAICETPLYGVNAFLKRASDIVISLAVLALIWPVMLAIAAGVKLSSPGPVVFRQRRYGMDGEEIIVWKFRSMTVTEDGDRIPQATRDDRRITPFGAFLRRSSLDELPQFINVLQGSMSIVGPRPHAVAHNEQYRRLIKGYMVRHKVKPGITGWAQINGMRGETETVEKMQKRVEYDLDYLRNWSLSLDLWIIFRTVALVFKDRHAF